MPVAAWLELTFNQTWTNRLAWPNLLSEPDRHTPYQVTGTFLPPEITKNTTYTPAQNPILLRGTVTVKPGVTVTFAPGTQIWAFEFSELDVEGRLVSQGTAQQPVAFVTNEQNSVNQTWNGLSFKAGSHGDLQYVHLEHGSPSLSCLAGSQVSLSHGFIQYGSLGIYNVGSACQVRDTRIEVPRPIQNI